MPSTVPSSHNLHEISCDHTMSYTESPIPSPSQSLYSVAATSTPHTVFKMSTTTFATPVNDNDSHHSPAPGFTSYPPGFNPTNSRHVLVRVLLQGLDYHFHPPIRSWRVYKVDGLVTAIICLDTELFYPALWPHPYTIIEQLAEHGSQHTRLLGRETIDGAPTGKYCVFIVPNCYLWYESLPEKIWRKIQDVLFTVTEALCSHN